MNCLVKLPALVALGLASSPDPLRNTSGKKDRPSPQLCREFLAPGDAESYDLVTKKAVADHVVAAADVFTTADKEVPTQAAQIRT